MGQGWGAKTIELVTTGRWVMQGEILYVGFKKGIQFTIARENISLLVDGGGQVTT